MLSEILLVFKILVSTGLQMLKLQSVFPKPENRNILSQIYSGCLRGIFWNESVKEPKLSPHLNSHSWFWLQKVEFGNGSERPTSPSLRIVASSPRPVLYLMFSWRNDRPLGNVDKEDGVLPVKSEASSLNGLTAQKTGWFAFYPQCISHWSASLWQGFASAWI